MVVAVVVVFWKKWRTVMGAQGGRRGSSDLGRHVNNIHQLGARDARVQSRRLAVECQASMSIGLAFEGRAEDHSEGARSW